MKLVNIGKVSIGEGKPKLVVALVAANEQEALDQAARACEAGADILEWRIDYAQDVDDTAALVSCAKALRQTCGDTPIIATVRTAEEGGKARISIERYEDILLAIIQSGAIDSIDVEVSLEKSCVARIIDTAHAQGLAVIGSFHDIESTPDAIQMRNLYALMAQEGVDICKVACTAHSFSDALTVMAATSAYTAQEDAHVAVGIAMGDDGTLSRVAAEMCGSALCFASLDELSAPGQLSIEQSAAFLSKIHEATTQHCYSEFRCVNLFHEDIEHVALLGSPVAHSLSPAIHNASFATAGMKAFYAALDCSKDTIEQAIAAMKANPKWVGANVTMPCKQEVIKYLDGLDDAAQLIGAVNTIALRDGRAIGYNTDSLGFTASIKAYGLELRNQKVYVMGAGGAASAVTVASALEGAASVDVVCRVESPHRESMEKLCSRVFEQTGCAMNVLVYRDVQDLAMIVPGADILVNATPVGMGQEAAALPVPTHMFHPEMTVVDLIYYPQQTRFLKEAAAKGCRTIPGLGMLLYQAAEAERIWFDMEMDVAAIAQALFSVV